jgi:hypothetical protein
VCECQRPTDPDDLVQDGGELLTAGRQLDAAAGVGTRLDQRHRDT